MQQLKSPSVLLAVLVAVLLSSCKKLERALFSPRISISCNILGKRCRFLNHGDPGEACFKVEVFHKESGRVIVSDPVCSGRINRDTPKWVELSFPRADPTTLCMGEDLRRDFTESCQVEIVEIE